MASSTRKADRTTDDQGHSWQEHRLFHITDLLLRRNGFRIKMRHKDDEPVWEKNGITFKQTDALLRVKD